MKQKCILFIFIIMVYVCLLIGCGDNSSPSSVDSNILNSIKESTLEATVPKIVYASEEKVIICDYWGLLLYDLSKEEITDLIDLKKIDMNNMQGSTYTQIRVTDDGKYIMMENIMAPDDQASTKKYIYDITNSKLQEVENIDYENNTFFDSSLSFLDENAKKDIETIPKYYLGNYVKYDQTILYLSLGSTTPTTTMKDLRLILLENDTSKEYEIFK